MVTDCSLAVFLWIRVHGRVCMSSLFLPLGCFISSPSRLHYHPDSLMVTGQVNSCRWFYNPWGGGVTQDKIRATNNRGQWTDETERERMEEWKEVIKARFKRLNRDFRAVAVACFLVLQQMEISGSIKFTGISGCWPLRFSVHHLYFSHRTCHLTPHHPSVSWISCSRSIPSHWGLKRSLIWLTNLILTLEHLITILTEWIIQISPQIVLFSNVSAFHCTNLCWVLINTLNMEKQQQISAEPVCKQTGNWCPRFRPSHPENSGNMLH